MNQRQLLIGSTLDTLKGTAADFEMILTSQSVQLPEAKTEMIDIPFGDGAIDLTEALTGEVNYHERTGAFTLELLDQPFNRTMQVNKLANYLQGRRMLVVRPDEPDWYYNARLSIADIEEAVMLSRLTLNMVAEPYKLKKAATVVTVAVTDKKDIDLKNSRMPLIPEVTTSAAITIVRGSQRIAVGAGTHKSLNLKLTEGSNKMTIEGAANVTFKYREGEL